MNHGGKAFRSGELARLTGVSPDTLRHYERIGILPKPPRTASGYRIYPGDAADRVRLVQRALQIGFTLDELSEILRLRDDGGAPCGRVLKMTEEKLRQLQRRIRELRQSERYMLKLVRQWRKRLASIPSGERAMLLHALAGKPTMTTNLRAHSLGGKKQ